MLLLAGIGWLMVGSQDSKAASSGIFTENAEAVDSISTEHPASLLQIAYASPRFTIENAQSISTIGLEPLVIEDSSQPQTTSSARIVVENAISMSTLNIEPPSGLLHISTPASPPTQDNQSVPASTPSTTEVEQIALETGQPYVNLYGHKQDVIVGEKIILYLSVVNPITSSGTMSVQLTLAIPSGWSVTSSEFGHGAGGLRTNTYEIEQGPNLREIDVHILANELFEGNVIGYLDYYFDNDNEAKFSKEIKLPVKATTAQPITQEPPIPTSPTSNWWQKTQWFIPIVIIGIALVASLAVFIIRATRRI